MTMLLLILYPCGIFPETASTIPRLFTVIKNEAFEPGIGCKEIKEDECSIDGRNKMAAVFPVSIANVKLDLVIFHDL